jgi:hypothetical protein
MTTPSGTIRAMERLLKGDVDLSPNRIELSQLQRQIGRKLGELRTAKRRRWKRDHPGLRLADLDRVLKSNSDGWLAYDEWSLHGTPMPAELFGQARVMTRALAYQDAQQTRDEVFREYLHTQLMEGRPDNDDDDPIVGHYGNVSEAELEAAIAATTMSREDYLECERIAAEEADFVARTELEGRLAAIDRKAVRQ